MLEESVVQHLRRQAQEKTLGLIDPEKAEHILVCFPDESLLSALRQRFERTDVQILDESSRNQYLQKKQYSAGERFDYILVGQWLEQEDFPKELPNQLGLLLKPSGVLLAFFANTMHWSSWSSLAGNRWQCDEHNTLTRSKKKFYRPGVIQNYWSCSFYQSAQSVPVEYPAEPAISQKLDRLYKGDVAGQYQIAYLVYEAQGFDYNTVWLRQFFTEEIRRDLAYTIHRIEYDIQVMENCHRILEMCTQYQISSQYLVLMIRNVAIDKEKVFSRIFTQEA